jgi:glycosyltransferase involved in cell wall biosynthesis
MVDTLAPRPVEPGAALPLVSVIVPCRNEERHIRACLDSVLRTSYPLDLLQILVVDGRSSDGTRAIITEYASEWPQVRLLDNPAYVVPTGLNIAIAAAAGDVIMRMDAHCTYPINYIPDLVGWLATSGADNVGGVWETLPGDDTPKAKAIAIALSHPFGVGNSYFRIGTAEPRWVDTVPFGCFARGVFDRIGGFDEDLVRNQDDEFNCRLIARGGRVLLVPGVVSHYRARHSLAQVARMYFQYGYFKPLVARKLGRIMTVRQLVPATFLIAMSTMLLLSPVVPLMATLLVITLCFYALAVSLAVGQTVQSQSTACSAWLFTVFPLLHVTYGFGFLRGVFDFMIIGRASKKDLPISR